MKTIAIANQKGGTGKTTTAYNLGIALTQQGYRVLMVDFDPQGNLSCYCGIPPEQDLEQTITELLMKVAYEKPLSHRECVYQSKRTDDSAPQVDFIPSNLRLASFELAMGTMMCREVLLKTCLEQYSSQYDYCIIDCSPSVGLLLTNALSAANEVIIPMQAQPFSVVGMSQLTNSISSVQRKINPGLHIRGVLLTMTQHTKVSEHYAHDVRAKYGRTLHVFTTEMLFDLSGHIHGFSKTQGTNAIFINPDAAADAVCGGISDCLQQAGIRDTDLNEICLFIPGFKNSANAVRDRFPKTRLMVLGDEYNAYYGALGEPGGIAVLSGTGSFAVCRDKKGSWISVGGWGPLFGDKGSGYHMGLMCLDRITQQWDRGSTNTLLQTLALKQLHMESIPSLRQGAYKPDFTREKIAKLSYTVAEAAKAGDIDALRILDEASVCLADLAAAVARRVGNDELPVSLLGGTSHMGDIFTKRFEAALKEKLPQCSYRKPMFEPIVGAALFVMYEIVGRMDSREDFLKNIQAEWGTTYVNG